MSLPTLIPNDLSDITLVKLANELAVNHYPLDKVLAHHQIDEDTWEHIKNLPRFQQLLREKIEEWHRASNTHERLKLRAAGMMEQSLDEIYLRTHDRTEPLNAKVEVWKLLARIGDVGVAGAGIEGGGEKFSITINLGADQIKIDKQLPMKVIEHDGQEKQSG
jgi:hypothetical protein